VAELQLASAARGGPVEWSFALDSLQAERDQAVTIAGARYRAAIRGRAIEFRDAPGHARFAGAAASAAAGSRDGLLIVDARAGWTPATARHARMAATLGVERWILAVNKMDLADWRQDAFDAVARRAALELSAEGATLAAAIPVCAREAENFDAPSARSPWYRGPSLFEALAALSDPPDAASGPLRVPIQDVYRRGDARVLVGQVESGALRRGMDLLFSPGGERAVVAELLGAASGSVPAGRDAAFTLDRAVYVARGEVASRPADAPALAASVAVRLVWIDSARAAGGFDLRARLGTADVAARVALAADVEQGGTAPARIEFARAVALDDRRFPGALDRGVLVEDGRAVAGFAAVPGGAADVRRRLRADVTLGGTAHAMSVVDRAALRPHRGGVIWLTGLSGAGKSTLAVELERRLFAEGWSVYLLDGDNLRHGLCSDLGFSPLDRRENIRRAGEVAALMADAGMLCVAAFVSPYRDDRARARAATGEAFREVHVRARLETCEKRDTKGLYAKARAGLLAEFTGVNAPYETPLAPDLTIDTDVDGVEICAATLLDLARASFGKR
jgi:bifunctional enzyme CysN/CysC